jgi:Flp pilus assembly protein TadG
MFFLQGLKAFRRSDCGSALVEFSASATLFILVMFGIMETARALYVANFVSNAAPEAIRYAMVRGSTWNGAACSEIWTRQCTATSANVSKYLDSLAPAGVSTSSSYLTVTTTWPGTTPSGASCSAQGVNNAPGCIVRVNITYSFSFLFPFMPNQPLSFSSSSAMAISQ